MLNDSKTWNAKERARARYAATAAAVGASVDIDGTSQSVKDLGDGAARLRLDGPIDSLFGFDVSAAVRELESIDGLKRVDVVISSPGGNGFDGLVLYDELMALRRAGVVVNTEGRGLVASAATFVFAAGDSRTLSRNTAFMVHEGSVTLMFHGTKSDLDDLYESVSGVLDTVNANMSAVYEATGVDSDTVAEWVAGGDHWLSPEEAVESGLATAVVGIDASVDPKVVGAVTKEPENPVAEDEKDKKDKASDADIRAIREIAAARFAANEEVA